jgi:hypothetical protein
MAIPASSAAAVTSSSRTLPPGWITAATPAAATMSSPSRNGKKASLAAAPPRARAPALSTASLPQSTRFCWPAPTPTAMPSVTTTTALERTWAQTRHAISRSRHWGSVGATLVTTRHSSRPVANR